jgi:peptidoglycan/LPS O-acetylase OafA/YrhL
MKRVIELDGIRGIAALVVVCYHLAHGLAPQGWMAVDCFFVLSGYLITSILLANRDDPHYFFNFYARRSLRIWPIYYLTLLLVMVAYRFMPTNYPINAGIIVQYFTYTQHVQWIWFDPEYHAIRAYDHTWTLAIEEQFYMLWPLLVRTAMRRGLASICITIAAGSVFLRHIGMSPEVLPARCDGFALGSLLALAMSGRYAFAEGRGIRLRIMLMAVMIAGSTVALSLLGPREMPAFLGEYLFPSWNYWAIGPINVLFFGLIGIVILNAGREWLAFLRWHPLVYIGTISYGLYLYHIPVMYAVEAVFRKLGSGHTFDANRPLYRLIIELSISLVVASLSWRFIEQPILGLKSRFHYKVAPDVANAAGRLGQSVPSPA